jgi:hypothetical protein
MRLSLIGRARQNAGDLAALALLLASEEKREARGICLNVDYSGALLGRIAIVDHSPALPPYKRRGEPRALICFSWQALERFPLAWNHASGKNSLRFTSSSARSRIWRRRLFYRRPP